MSLHDAWRQGHKGATFAQRAVASPLTGEHGAFELEAGPSGLYLLRLLFTDSSPDPVIRGPFDASQLSQAVSTFGPSNPPDVQMGVGSVASTLRKGSTATALNVQEAGFVANMVDAKELRFGHWYLPAGKFLLIGEQAPDTSLRMTVEWMEGR